MNKLALLITITKSWGNPLFNPIFCIGFIVDLLMGASTVKWTGLDSCLGLGESDPKLYTNF